MTTTIDTLDAMVPMDQLRIQAEQKMADSGRTVLGPSHSYQRQYSCEVGQPVRVLDEDNGKAYWLHPHKDIDFTWGPVGPTTFFLARTLLRDVVGTRASGQFLMAFDQCIVRRWHPLESWSIGEVTIRAFVEAMIEKHRD